LLGGQAKLDQIYDAIEPKRSTETTFWREKVREQLQLHFTRTGQGEYALAA
jgi:predicted membrane metal-binding protein